MHIGRATTGRPRNTRGETHDQQHVLGRRGGPGRPRRPLLRRQRDERIVGDALSDQATKAAWKTIPSWTLVTLEDLAVPAEAQRFMAQRASSTVVEVNASHAVTVSRPVAVARLIDEAARATAA